MAYGDVPAARHMRSFAVASRKRGDSVTDTAPGPQSKSATSLSLRPDPKYSTKRRVALAVAVLVGAAGTASLTVLVLFG